MSKFDTIYGHYKTQIVDWETILNVSKRSPQLELKKN